MALTSLQVCMDSSDCLQGTVNDQENGMDSSKSPSGGDNILMCSRPLIERRLRPPHDQALKCPRCDSTHTKFCYYNNYSLSQPRYFCKTCRRYWTKGGTLRNIPVGGGCRKNKKVSNSKKSSSSSSDNNIAYASVIASSTDLHLSSPDMQFSHLNTLLAADHHHGSSHGNGSTTSFIDSKYNAFLGTNTARPIDQFMNHNFMGGDHLGIMSSNVVNDHHYQTFQENGGTTFNTNSTTTTPLYGGMSLDGGNINTYHGAFIDTCQRLMLPNYEDDDQNDGIEVKPNTKLLALEWQQQADDQSCGDDHLSVKDHNHHSFGYVNAGTLGTWNGLMNGYGSSATNPSLV